jgi:hypothetical protein
MDIEKLKLILETIQGVGQEAGNLAVLYMWLQFGTSAFGYLTFLGVVWAIAWAIYKAIRTSYGHDSCEVFFRDMRDQLRTGTGGLLTSIERDNTMAALRQLVAKEKQA